MTSQPYRGLSREVRELICIAENLGARVERTRRHVQVKVAGGGIVTLSATPSDSRSIANMRSQLRRAGLPI